LFIIFSINSIIFIFVITRTLIKYSHKWGLLHR
jgi:hypothetical protein